MKFLDKFVENQSRSIEMKTSRRNFIAKLGIFMFGGTLLPLLPIDRTGSAQAAGKEGDPGDPTSCDYWRYCGVDGYLCSCCGGSVSSCPPGTEASAVTWIGTCRNPADGMGYLISYNDCCGKHACGQCSCVRSESDEPMYRPFSNNDLNWCLTTQSKSVIYHCTTAVIKGISKS